MVPAVNDHLISLGFQRIGYDSCLYVRRDDSGGELIVAVYIGDLFIAGSSSAAVSAFKRSLASKYDLTDLGELSQILGIEVTRDKGRKCFFTSSRPCLLRMPSQSPGWTICLPAGLLWIILLIPRLLPSSGVIFLYR